MQDEKWEMETSKKMEGRGCLRCGKVVPPGSLAYVVHIRVFADFDGVLLEPAGEIDRELDRILEEIGRSDPEVLEKEIYEEFALLLCKSCRDRFVSEAYSPWKGPIQVRKDPDKILN